MFRMQDPEKYALYDRLEEKCIAEKAMPELLDKLHDIRASNRDNLVSIIANQIDEAYWKYCRLTIIFVRLGRWCMAQWHCGARISMVRE